MTKPSLTLLAVSLLGAVLLAQPDPRRPVREGLPPRAANPQRQRLPQLAGTLTFIPSTAGGERGIAVRVLSPARPRYAIGAPVIIHVTGGVQAGSAGGRPEFAGLGFVEVFFAFPGGGFGEERSGGTYDFRGTNCHRAFADVIRFATGRLADRQGRKITDLVGDTKILTKNIGLLGSSHGGNACGLAMLLHGSEFPDLAFYASMESPYGEGNVNVELGGRETGVNPAYNPGTGQLDLSKLAWSSDLTPGLRGRETPEAQRLRGSLFFDLDGDGRFSPAEDFPANAFVADLGQGVRVWYSARLLREAERRALWGRQRPAHLPTAAEAAGFWRQREVAGSLSDAVKHCPNVAVIVYAGERDHVQAAPDHPHIIMQVEGWRQAGAPFVRLNPDRAYVEKILSAGPALHRESNRPLADTEANIAIDRSNIVQCLEPADLPINLYMQAAVCELADRVQAKDWSKNLDAVLFPNAPNTPPPGPPGGENMGPRPLRPRGAAPGSRGNAIDRTLREAGVVAQIRPANAGPRPNPAPGTRPSRPPPANASKATVPLKPYSSGTKQIEVDAGKVVGRIHSLLGVNRGPLSFRRGADEPAASHVESYKHLGIDLIRTHDFYGPTDWHVMFPDWKAAVASPESHDFVASDARIRSICENGFGCFFRLGTSWKGQQRRPINDPPGTLRDERGEITHRADREDFRKWAQVCVQTVRHYTAGWKDGFRFPITYWEIWNEPDLREQFWTGTPEQYWTMYEEAAKALKALNPKLKVGGPGCTQRLRQEYVAGFLDYCRKNNVPLDFFTWHSYGGRGETNPYRLYEMARQVRDALDAHGFKNAENILGEWNAGIDAFNFSDTPSGVAYYASVLMCLLDAGVDRALQYCGDNHPMLGLHHLDTGEPKLSAFAFAAWKRMLETPERLVASGSDNRGYNVLAGKDAAGNRVRVLISDFQSGHDAFHLRITNLPWSADTRFTVRQLLIDQSHRLSVVREVESRGRTLELEKPLKSGTVCLIELELGGA